MQKRRALPIWELADRFWEKFKKRYPSLTVEGQHTSDCRYIRLAYMAGFEAAERRYKKNAKA